MAAVVLLITVFSIFIGKNSQPTYKVDNGITSDELETMDTVEVKNMNFTNSQGISFTYTGQTINDKPNGIGTGQYDNGEYNGPYINGLRSGDNATFNTSDGENAFVGTFKNDEYYKGSLTLKSGEYFEGEFRNGQPYNGSWQNADGTFNSEIINGQ